jgi:hypothetical protein
MGVSHHREAAPDLHEQQRSAATEDMKVVKLFPVNRTIAPQAYVAVQREFSPRRGLDSRFPETLGLKHLGLGAGS